MSLFSRKENDDLFFLFQTNDNDNIDIESDSSPQPSHALTANEVISFNNQSDDINIKTDALNSLKKRMLEARNEPQNTSVEIKADAPIIKEAENNEQKEFDLNLFLGTKETVEQPVTEKTVIPENSPKKQTKSLLEKCRPYILDDDGGDSAMKTKKSYELESVADILKSESEKALEILSSKYDVSFDDLGKPEKKAEQKKTESTPNVQKTAEKQVFEDIMPTAVHNVQTNVSHIISDIDNNESKADVFSSTDISNTATIKFTPVTSTDSSRGISISSQTRPIDLTGEITSLPDDDISEDTNEISLEQTEFDEYEPTEEFSSEKSSKTFLRKFSIIKRGSFLKSVATGFLTLILGAAKFPFMSETILAHTKAANIICAAILGIILLINFDIFKSLSKIVSRRSTPDICAVLSSLTVLSYTVVATLKNIVAVEVIILGAFTLFIRALSEFFVASYLLSGFKQISGNTPKRAIKLIGDQAVTFAMTKDFIEGDVLAAAPQRTNHIDGYIKFSTFRVFFAGKLPAITIISLFLSVAVGLACSAYFDGAVYGLYSAAAIQCFTAMPIIFLIDNLPLYSASKKLAKSGAMVGGKAGAERIENANAVVFNSADIFPSGTVSLHQLKILSNNSVDDTIIRAASLTEALNSPLSPIFKKIAGTSGDIILPKSDTLKYEDKMGISGWVDNKLLFIGNRTLMAAHGISVPDVETDRKILRSGFFPVYVASEDKACALLTVKYSVRPEIAKALRKVSALGVTMLINSTDPNMTEEMICDYMGLYDDTVKIMSSAGCHMYKNAVTFSDSIVAPAAYKGNPVGLSEIIVCSGKIKKSNTLLTVMYVLSAVLGAVMFTYMSFDGSGSLMSSVTVLLYNLICTVLTYIIYLTQKP